MNDGHQPIDRRGILRASGGLAALGASLLAGCAGTAPSEDGTSSSTGGADTETSPDPTPTSEGDPEGTPSEESLGFHGEGPQSTDRFELDGGLVVLEAEYAGTGPFYIELLDEQGERRELPVNTVGEWSGTVAFHADAGAYGLHVEGDGDWEITFSQPRPVSGGAPSVAMEGSHSNVLGPFESDGEVHLEYRNNGKHVEILLLDEDGKTREVLVQESGDDVDVSETFAYDGLYYVFVDTRLVDSWELVLEEEQ